VHSIVDFFYRSCWRTFLYRQPRLSRQRELRQRHWFSRVNRGLSWSNRTHRRREWNFPRNIKCRSPRRQRLFPGWIIPIRKLLAVIQYIIHWLYQAIPPALVLASGSKIPGDIIPLSQAKMTSSIINR